MLRRNGLIAPEDVRLLSQWLECLGMAVMFLLEGMSVEQAFNVYAAAYPSQAERLKNPLQKSLTFEDDSS